jgi:hypothetical protein
MIKKKNLFDKKKEVSIPDKQAKEELKEVEVASRFDEMQELRERGYYKDYLRSYKYLRAKGMNVKDAYNNSLDDFMEELRLSDHLHSVEDGY